MTGNESAAHRGWPLTPLRCPCDLDLIDWLRTRRVHGATIMHFGTGSHHVVGRDNHLRGANVVIGITASDEEHGHYRRLVAADPRLAQTYQVWCTDIYSLPARVIPPLDIATLFHLCEFSAHPDDDRRLMTTLAAAIRPGGHMLFYTGSDGYRETEPLILDAIDHGVLRIEESSGSLRICVVGGS